MSGEHTPELCWSIDELTPSDDRKVAGATVDHRAWLRGAAKGRSTIFICLNMGADGVTGEEFQSVLQDFCAAPETAAERDRLRAEMDSWKASYVTTEKYANDLAALRTENAELVDFVRNIAALDDRLLGSRTVLRQWRADARAALAKVTATEGEE